MSQDDQHNHQINRLLEEGAAFDWMTGVYQQHKCFRKKVQVTNIRLYLEFYIDKNIYRETHGAFHIDRRIYRET